jgi:hypothetical protein
MALPSHFDRRQIMTYPRQSLTPEDIQDRHWLTPVLNNLLRGFRFTWGQPAQRALHDVQVPESPDDPLGKARALAARFGGLQLTPHLPLTPGLTLYRLLEADLVAFGRQAQRTIDDIQISVSPYVDPQGETRALVTLFAGFSPLPALRGLRWEVQTTSGQIVRSGVLDARGQFWLRDLIPGEYRLDIQALCPGGLIETLAGLPEDAAIVSEPPGRLGSQLVASHFAGEEIVQEFHSDDPEETVLATLSLSEANQLILDVEVRQDAVFWGGYPLARFTLTNREHVVLLRGFTGLYAIITGKAFGKVVLSHLAADLGQWISTGCYLRIDPQDPAHLTALDRDDLEGSRGAAGDPRCRKVLDEALGRLQQEIRPDEPDRPADGTTATE